MPSRGSERFQGSEADLCDWLIEREASRGWVAYPEHAGWDVLMVRSRDAYQLGIQAKLRPNCDVLEQAATCMDRPRRPDRAAVLVGYHPPYAFRRLAVRVGVEVISWHPTPWGQGRDLDSFARPGFPGRASRPVLDGAGGLARHELPPFVPAVRAGLPAPAPLTKWKLAALRLCMLLDRQGYVTTEDVKRLGMSPTRWLGLLRLDGHVPGRRLARLVRGSEQLPDQQYPELAAQVAAHYGEEVPRG